jgi:hypothetical protein
LASVLLAPDLRDERRGAGVGVSGVAAGDEAADAGLLAAGVRDWPLDMVGRGEYGRAARCGGSARA